MPVAPSLYPVNLVVEGRPCLVVGGGSVAARKVEGLRVCGARIHVVAPRVSPEIGALAEVTWEERPYRGGEAGDYSLVVAATSDTAVNHQVAADADAAGVWVNVADDPDSCTFTLPSVLRRGPITVAVSTGGRSPALSSWLKHRLDAELGPEYEVLVGLLSAERDAIRAAGGSTEGLDWQSALDSDMLELIRAGQVERARERLQSCLSSS
jgi:siroheme synthase-like protein